MLIQSQAESEAILADLLSRNGIVVERGVELVSVSETESRVTVQLKHGSGQSESFVFDYLFAADGAHSSVRKQLGLTFKGDAYAEKWLLYDMELTLRLAQDEAHAFILDQGALFMVRIKSDIWRIIGNVSDLLSYLPAGSEPGKIHWQSDFSISHRITDKFSSGRIFLGGDAAHIHSGLGARGMNLGIEDAFVFAELYANNQLHVYHDKRTQAVRDTVRQIRSLTEMMRGKSIPSKLFRKVAPAVLPAVFPLIEKNIRQFVLGLNHDV
jgi:2-polyprenyl-6-methoxyphenol hydroxylase-like FAD-dependent oxidoreductase